jgi:hypothetical protein
MKVAPVRFYYQRARIFGWLMILSIIAFTLVSIFEGNFK